jgi:hypothetical protein
MKPRDVMNRLNEQLPEGLRVLNCQLWSRNAAFNKNGYRTYEIRLSHDSFDKVHLDAFIRQEEWTLQRTNRKGHTATLDLKETITDMDLQSSNQMKIKIKIVPGKTPRPIDVLSSVFHLSEVSVKQARIIKVE